MRIVSAKIENYKSFLSSDELHFEPGFNVLVGQNNAGKTALIEALSLSFDDRPHHSPDTVPYPGAQVYPFSEITITLEVSGQEVFQILTDEIDRAGVLVGTKEEATHFFQDLPKRNLLSFTASPGSNRWRLVHSLTRGRIPAAQHNQAVTGIPIAIRKSPGRQAQIDIEKEQRSFNPSDSLDMKLAMRLRDRIYAFKAERLKIGETSVEAVSDLLSDASNLAQVLNVLQTRDPPCFARLEELVNIVLPEIRRITAPPIGSNRIGIFIWGSNPADPFMSRPDLAVPLSQSGTGVGQVLAILYVVLTSTFPRTILIDEPQSFLHPGAIRKLFEILKYEQYAQHQYIVATHSPTVIASATPHALYLVRKEEAASVVAQVDPHELKEVTMCLSEVGARLLDVFGADNILWVEGRTEEECFPLILSRIVKCPLYGTEILGVVNVSDLEGKQKKTVFEIYGKLSQGRAMLPPAIGFIFDREGRSEQDCLDIEKASKGTVHFLPRRMYENYLLVPEAIAALMSGLPKFREGGISTEVVRGWLEQHQWESKYFQPLSVTTEERTSEFWFREVRGEKVLNDMFKELSEQRYDGYSRHKPVYGKALTEWIIDNAPEELKEIADLLVSILHINSLNA